MFYIMSRQVLLSRGFCHRTYPTTRIVSAQVWGKIRGEKEAVAEIEDTGGPVCKGLYEEKKWCAVHYVLFILITNTALHMQNIQIE